MELATPELERTKSKVSYEIMRERDGEGKEWSGMWKQVQNHMEIREPERKGDQGGVR